MNQGKLEVVKQEMARVNVDQLCPVDPYMMMEMFSIYIVLLGSYQSDVATEYV